VFDLSGPIIRSRLEPDFYKFTMGQLIWRKYRDVEVTFTLSNRTKQARLGRVLDLGELRHHFDHARSLMFTDAELQFLRDLDAYETRLFDDDYLASLRELRLPPYRLDRIGDDLALEFTGRWAEVTYWETIALSIVSEVYSRTLLRTVSRLERAAIVAEGIRRLRDKVAVLRAHPEIHLTDFGTRRRFSGEWQYFVDEVLRDELNRGASHGPFLGTSNTHAAMVTGIVPTGTSAHELPMILAGLYDEGDASPQPLRRAQRQVIDDWWESYGSALSIFLPDTFGTDVFFSVVTDDDLRRWKGFRWDSGPMMEFGERVIAAYTAIAVDAKEKALVLSDALDLPAILQAQERFAGRIHVSFGWGTGLTNDFFDRGMVGDTWWGPMSMVIKPTRANGRGLVKLSDNPAKAIGDPQDVERYKQAASYGEHQLVTPKY
jgi:nicotinate phosphoribosyltransferase